MEQLYPPFPSHWTEGRADLMEIPEWSCPSEM